MQTITMRQQGADSNIEFEESFGIVMLKITGNNFNSDAHKALQLILGLKQQVETPRISADQNKVVLFTVTKI